MPVKNSFMCVLFCYVCGLFLEESNCKSVQLFIFVLLLEIQLSEGS